MDTLEKKNWQGEWRGNWGRKRNQNNSQLRYMSGDRGREKTREKENASAIISFAGREEERETQNKHERERGGERRTGDQQCSPGS